MTSWIASPTRDLRQVTSSFLSSPSAFPAPAISVLPDAALVLVADGQPEPAGLLCTSLSRSGLRAYCVGDGRQALQGHLSLRPDLVLLDVRLPHIDGWQVLVELRRRGDTPVIMLSDQEHDRLVSLRMGADDYVAKPFNPADVVARIEAVLRRRGAHHPAHAHAHQRRLQVGPLQIDFDSHEVIVHPADDLAAVPLTLTLAEFRLLAHLARAPRRVTSRAELLYACLPEGDSLERTVDSHISRLRKKLERAGVIGMPVAVRGVGYKLCAMP